MYSLPKRDFIIYTDIPNHSLLVATVPDYYRIIATIYRIIATIHNVIMSIKKIGFTFFIKNEPYSDNVGTPNVLLC